MRFTGNTPVSSVAPPHDDALPQGQPNAVRGRDPGLPPNLDEVPAGLLDALLHAPAVETDRLDRARTWLRQRRDDVDDVPTSDELAGCILDDAVVSFGSR